MKRVILPMTAAVAIALSTSGFAVQNSNAVSTTALSSQVKQLSAETKKLQREVRSLKKEKKKTTVGKNHQENNTVPWPRFVTVSTTNFLGKRMAYDGADLLYNLTSINEDMFLLQQNQKILDLLHSQGYHLDRPLLQVGGEVEGEFSSVGGFNSPTSNSISLSTAELQFNAIASSWAEAFMSLDFTGGPISTGNREPNSTIYLGRGFLTIGNLNVTPFYFTLGKMNVPFGRYANGMVSTSYVQSMGKMQIPAVLVGYTKHGFYGSVYGFTGSQTSGPSDIVKQEGVNAGYRNTFENGNYGIGAGWVSNIADSQGMQGNGLPATGTQFAGFGAGTTTNNLAHRVDGVDVHGAVTYRRFSLLGEFLGAGERFAVTDMSYNNRGAEPKAMHAEIDYMLPFVPKKYNASIGVAYEKTWQALALNLARNKYAVFLNTTLWRETTFSVEYNHQEDYASSAVANGGNAATNITGTGKGSNAVLAEFGVFF